MWTICKFLFLKIFGIPNDIRYLCKSCSCIPITYDMKKTYLTPEDRVNELELEQSFLQSGLNAGIDPLGDPEDDDPWGNN